MTENDIEEILSKNQSSVFPTKKSSKRDLIYIHIDFDEKFLMKLLQAPIYKRILLLIIRFINFLLTLELIPIQLVIVMLLHR